MFLVDKMMDKHSKDMDKEHKKTKKHEKKSYSKEAVKMAMSHK